MFDYDVMVVGCGPAGLMAAAELKEKGINVLGVDKKPRLDVNVRSASGFFIDGQEMNGEYIQLEPLKGKTRINFTKCGFSLEHADWWNSTFEWNRNPKRMADYGKRVLFNRFFTSDELDFLFNLTQKYPVVADELGGGVYDYTHVIADYFIGLPEVPPELKERLKRIKEADMGQIQSLVSKRRY